MKYIAQGREVKQELRNNDKPHTVATCFNDQWASHIAYLLQRDYDGIR